MNDALIWAIFQIIEERLRRRGLQESDRDEISANALAEYFAQNPEIFHTIASCSPIVLLALRLAKLPEKKALSQYFSQKNRRAQWEKNVDFSEPENDRFYESRPCSSPALLAERRDDLAAIRRVAESLGAYRGASRFDLLLAQFESGESLSTQAERLGVQVDTVRAVNRKTITICRKRLGVEFA